MKNEARFQIFWYVTKKSKFHALRSEKCGNACCKSVQKFLSPFVIKKSEKGRKCTKLGLWH